MADNNHEISLLKVSLKSKKKVVTTQVTEDNNKEP